jgi:C4-dicarboxylate transporter DctM subunit
VVANCSIAGLFMAGFLPGFILTFLMCLTCYIMAKKNGFK